VSASYQSSFTPGRQPPPISFTGQPDLRAGLGVVNGEIPSHFSNKTLMPQQLGHNLVNIMPQLTQPFFIKNHNMESRTHGHPYFLMVHTDMHAHTHTNKYMARENKLHSYCANWNDHAQNKLYLTKRLAPSMLEMF
jgi:hypothetical protein